MLAKFWMEQVWGLKPHHAPLQISAGQHVIRPIGGGSCAALAMQVLNVCTFPIHLQEGKRHRECPLSISSPHTPGKKGVGKVCTGRPTWPELHGILLPQLRAHAARPHSEVECGTTSALTPTCSIQGLCRWVGGQGGPLGGRGEGKEEGQNTLWWIADEG